MLRGSPFLALASVVLLACQPAPLPPPAGPPPAPGAEAPVAANATAALVDSLASVYLDGYLEAFPEYATWMGVAGARHDRIADNSLAALAAWREREDAWLTEVRRIDAAALRGTPSWTTYRILREALESSIATRVCRTELWNVNSYVDGWQARYTDLARLQPVGSDSLRAQALARARALPGFIDTEVQNLRAGVRQGDTAPGVIVRSVLRQLDAILATPPAESPFASPAQRDSAPDFRRTYVGVVERDIHPAVRRYRDYLAREYLPFAREELGVSALPNGAECYRATVRAFSTLDVPPDEVFRLGEREMQRIQAKMREIAERDFGTTDVPALLRRLKSDPRYTFRTGQEVIDSSQAAVDRARTAMPRAFGRLPRAEVVIEPYPGHHLQLAIARERAGAHPLGRSLFNSGFSEGWALYAEQLGDELGLYSTPTGRMGMLSSDAFRAARLVIDAGIHARGWTREQALEYMLAHTTLPSTVAEGGDGLLKTAITRLGLSARAYHRILKIARTVADLDGAAEVGTAHVSEAIQYRSLDRLLRG